MMMKLSLLMVILFVHSPTVMVAASHEGGEGGPGAPSDVPSDVPSDFPSWAPSVSASPSSSPTVSAQPSDLAAAGPFDSFIKDKERDTGKGMLSKSEGTLFPTTSSSPTASPAPTKGKGSSKKTRKKKMPKKSKKTSTPTTSWPPTSSPAPTEGKGSAKSSKGSSKSGKGSSKSSPAPTPTVEDGGRDIITANLLESIGGSGASIINVGKRVAAAVMMILGALL